MRTRPARTTTVTLLALAAVASGVAHAQVPAARPRLAVLPLAGNNVAAHVPPALDDVIALEIGRSQRFEVIASSEIRSMLGLEEMKQAVGCDDAGCIAEIGGALDVTYVVSGKVSRLGDEFHVSLTLSDVKAARVEARALETVAANEGLLSDASRRAVASLLREQRAPSPVALGPVAANAGARAAGPDAGAAGWGGWTLPLAGGSGVALAGCLGGIVGNILTLVVALPSESNAVEPTNMFVASPASCVGGWLCGATVAAVPVLLNLDRLDGLEVAGLILLPAAVASALGGGAVMAISTLAYAAPDTLDGAGLTLDDAFALVFVVGVPATVISAALGGVTFAWLARSWTGSEEADLPTGHADPPVPAAAAPAGR